MLPGTEFGKMSRAKTSPILKAVIHKTDYFKAQKERRDRKV